MFSRVRIAIVLGLAAACGGSRGVRRRRFARRRHELVPVELPAPPWNEISYDGYNRTLRSPDRAYRNLRVFEWAAMARARPKWFGSNGVHPDSAGYRARAAAIARLIERC